jgi:hypothetical protein
MNLKENSACISLHSMLTHKFFGENNILCDPCRKTKNIMSIVILEHQFFLFYMVPKNVSFFPKFMCEHRMSGCMYIYIFLELLTL